MNYYNEWEPFAARWLAQLMAGGHIPEGSIDDRSITDVHPGDLWGYIQCHFFAGIGGWPEALRLAGWPADREVWTGSCPCQPFSTAGKHKGAADERHLWPEFLCLIAECRPATIFGEQVAGKDGREWFARVRADLEALGYAVGCLDLCAASVGAPHIRQRLFWVADAEYSVGRWVGRSEQDVVNRQDVGVRRMGNAPIVRPFSGQSNQSIQPPQQARGSSLSFWSDAEWFPCLDGKARRTQPSIQPLAYGVSGRVEMGKLRAAGNAIGNAIVPQVAATFIKAFMESDIYACFEKPALPLLFLDK